MKKVLFIECGRSGYGGSFHSLYITIKNLSPKKYKCNVIFFNKTVFYEKLTRIGAECNYIDDIIFSDGKKCQKYILGKLNGFLLRYLPLLSVWCEYIIHRNTILKITKIARKKDIDLIHLNNQIALNFMGVFVAQSLSIPCVSHLRTFNSYGFNQFKIAYTKTIKLRYVAISKQIKRHWIKRGLDSDMIEVIHNVSQSFEDCEADDKDTALITEYNGHKLIFVGRLIACKGISFLIESFKMVLNSGIHAKLYLLGSGEEENSLRDIIYSQEVEEDVVFLGYRSNPLAIVKKMDLLILPSKEEGFGRVLLEAMGVGVAVIGTKVGGIPEIIDNEVNGLLVPYGDVLALKEAILRVLNDGILKRRIINAGFCTLQSKFNIEHYSRKLENVYDSFLN